MAHGLGRAARSDTGEVVMGVDFGKPTPVQDVRIYLDGAGGNFGDPKSYTL